MAQFEGSSVGLVRRFSELHREQLSEMQQLQTQSAASLFEVWLHDRTAALRVEWQTLWQRLFDLIAPQMQV